MYRTLVTLALAVVVLASCNRAAREVKQEPVAAGMAPLPSWEGLFWDVFQAQEHARIPELLSALDGAMAAAPSDPRPVVLRGLVNLWALAEGELAHPADPPATVRAIIADFEKYAAMVPGDHRVPMWLASAYTSAGDAMVDAAKGMPPGPQRDEVHRRGEAMTARGLAAIDQGVIDEPRFNLFGRFIITALYPAKSERFRQAVEDIAAFHDARLHAKLDPHNPDVSPFLRDDSRCNAASPPPRPAPAGSAETTLSPDPKCWNSWKTPFSYEGFWLYSGDVAMKNGDARAARVMYENARRLSENYARWPYAFYLEERIANVDKWVKLYQDDDPKNDPELVYRAPFTCVVCHVTPGAKPVLPERMRHATATVK